RFHAVVQKFAGNAENFTVGVGMAEPPGIAHDTSVQGRGNLPVQGNLESLQEAVDNDAGGRLRGLYVNELADAAAPLMMVDVHKSFGLEHARRDLPRSAWLTVHHNDRAFPGVELLT